MAPVAFLRGWWRRSVDIIRNQRRNRSAENEPTACPEPKGRKPWVGSRKTESGAKQIALRASVARGEISLRPRRSPFFSGLERRRRSFRLWLVRLDLRRLPVAIDHHHRLSAPRITYRFLPRAPRVRRPPSHG